MFRIDDYTVVDATMSGGPARYINHSCDPNCQAEVVELDKGSKIIIITNRRISKGEEVSWFPSFYSTQVMVNVPTFITLFSRTANREDPDQTASSEAVWSGPALFV